MLTLKCFASFLVSKEDDLSIHALFAYGTIELHVHVVRNIGWRKRSDLKPRDPNILHEPLDYRKKIKLYILTCAHKTGSHETNFLMHFQMKVIASSTSFLMEL